MTLSNKDFVHLHNHGDHSLFDSQAGLEKLVMLAREMNFPAMALTDHGSVGGLIKFIKHCTSSKNKKGKEIPFPKIKPIPGCELYMSKNRFAKSKDEQPNMRKGNHHLIVLAKNFKGYQNLCQLSQLSFTEGFYMNPRIDFDALDKHHEGLVISTACLKGLVNSNLLHDRYDVAKKACGVFKEIFHDDFFLEI